MSNNLNSKQNKFASEDLKVMQNWDLDRKIEVSLTRIAEFYAKFPLKINLCFKLYKNSQVLRNFHSPRSPYTHPQYHNKTLRPAKFSEENSLPAPKSYP